MSILTRVDRMIEVKEYLEDLNHELSNSISDLEHASESNAIDVCREVAKRLNDYYKAL